MPFLKNIATSSLPDEELLRLYQTTAQVKVLGQLYERYMDMVYGVCLKYLQDTESAKDSVLQIFEELVTKLKKYEVQNFKSWLYQLAKNYCLMQLRANKKFSKLNVDVALMQNSDPVHLNGALEKEENFKFLDDCLAQLNTNQRQIVELFYLQGKSYKEIASLNGFDINTIRSYLQNGRRNLKLCMDKQKSAAAM